MWTRGKRRGRRINRTKEKEDLGPTSGVFNLSSKIVSTDELHVLNKGLKLAPKAKLNKFQTFIDIQKFTRQLRMKRYLIQNPILRNSNQSLE